MFKSLASKLGLGNSLESSNKSTLIQEHYPSRGPENHDWDTVDDSWEYDFQDEKIRVTYKYGCDYHGAAFYRLRVVDKIRKNNHYFTGTWYLRSVIESMVDSSYKHVIVYEYIRGHYCLNLETGMISKCFNTNWDSENEESLDESVTVLSGGKFYLSKHKLEIRDIKGF